MQLTDELVEQVTLRGRVTVSVFSSAAIVLARRLTVGSGGEPPRLHYRRRREHGDRHAAANRHLFNKLLGQLYHCLQQRSAFDAAQAFPQAVDAAA